MTQQVTLNGFAAFKTKIARAQKLTGLESVAHELGEIVLNEARRTLREDETSGGRQEIIENSLEIRQGATAHEILIGTKLDLGHHLEFGTTRMTARPWISPAIEAARPALRQKLKQALALMFKDQSTKENRNGAEGSNI